MRTSSMRRLFPTVSSLNGTIGSDRPEIDARSGGG
jgi:hypothetical protein